MRISGGSGGGENTLSPVLPSTALVAVYSSPSSPLHLFQGLILAHQSHTKRK